MNFQFILYRERKLMAGNAVQIKGGSNKARECDVNQLFVIRLDPSIINETNNGRPRAGNFHLSNPKLGEQLQQLILSSFRGPKDFDESWPIYDSTQSRYFWKVVQGIISELESQGVLPRSNLWDTLLVVCCGSRYNNNMLNFGWELMPPVCQI
ncbi:putative HAUS augmin-like complex subunit 6 [Helianthus debilis subsp. tardiflorus]